MRSERVVIMGGSHAGVSVIETLRREGFTGRMILVSDEAVPLFSPTALPYLYGERKRQGRTLRGLDFYRGLEVVRTRALAVEPAKSLVRLPGKGRVSYDRLVIATGASALTIPVCASGGNSVFSLRRIGDLSKIEQGAKKSRHIVIAGAGLVGLHLAQVFVNEGRQVHVVEREGQILPGLVHGPLTGYLQELLERQGITFSLGAGIADRTGKAVLLSNGREVMADMLVAAVGVRPNVEIVEGSAVVVRSAIVVNERMETSVPSIFACGDAAEYKDLLTGDSRTNPNVVSAAEQGRIAGECIAGKTAVHPGVISLNMFNCGGKNLFCLGNVAAEPGDALYYEREPGGDGTCDSFKSILFREGRLRAMLLYNVPVDGGTYYRLMKEKVDLRGLEEKILADPWFQGKWIAERYLGKEAGA